MLHSCSSPKAESDQFCNIFFVFVKFGFRVITGFGEGERGLKEELSLYLRN